MKATNLTRYGCTLGGRYITYDRLTRYYVCNECGGKIVHSFLGGDRVFCGECGGLDFVSETAYCQQVADGFEVLESLPADLRALLQPETEQVSAEQAIESLFG